MKTEPTNGRARLLAIVAGGLFFVLALVMLLLGFFEVLPWEAVRDTLLILATIGTAVGTLGLAAYTFQLARVTRESVAGAESQLVEVQKQGRLMEDQVAATLAQAEQNGRLAASSASAAMSAERARVDAIAPLVNLRVTLDNIEITQGGKTFAIDYQQVWSPAEVEQMVVVVSLKFSFRNVGSSPAQLSFGDTSTRLERVANEHVHLVVLEPGEAYDDIFRQRFVGREALEGYLLRMPVTYNGLLHGEMFDHIQWNGWVVPLKESDGIVIPNSGWFINASGAQVMRSYPNLARPQEMEEVRQRIMYGDRHEAG